MDAIAAPIGHNSGDVEIAIEVRLFNSLAPLLPGGRRALTLDAGATVGDVLRHVGVDLGDVYLVLRNGRDVTPSLHEAIRTESVLEDGDVLAVSGPVPYSWGYGSPVV